MDTKAQELARTGLTAATVLDPFAGSGTVGQVALELGRAAVLIELNAKYLGLIEGRVFNAKEGKV